MKKVLFIFCLLFVIAGLYAGDKYLSINGSLPVTWERTSQNGVTVKSTVLSMGFGFSFAQYFGEKWGLDVGFDVFFPQKLTLTTTEGTVSVGRDVYDSLWGIMFDLGPTFAVIRNDKMLFALNPGFHYMMLASFTSYMNSVGYMFGVGLSTEFDFKFTDLVYLRTGVDLAYDFYNYSVVSVPGKTGTNSGFTSDFSIVPKIGIGFNF